MTPLAFVDTETTGITPEAGEIYEVGLIVDRPGQKLVERHWWLPVNLRTADPIALDIGRFHERHPHGNGYTLDPGAGREPVRDPSFFAESFARLTHGCHLVGAVISFDERRLWDLLRREGVTPSWHYHLIDVEALAAGWVSARCEGQANDGVSQGTIRVRRPDGSINHIDGRPPWDSKDLSRAVGVDVDRFNAHEALEDARWAKAIYEAVMGK